MQQLLALLAWEHNGLLITLCSIGEEEEEEKVQVSVCVCLCVCLCMCVCVCVRLFCGVTVIDQLLYQILEDVLSSFGAMGQ